MLRFITCVLFFLPLAATGLAAQEAAATSDRAPATDKGETDRQVQQSVCLLLESAAHANELPVEFFVRLIWQESRFRPTAIGPRTRSGRHALGIAQFMPATAAERNLLDPLNPIEALPKAAEFLSAASSVTLDWRRLPTTRGLVAFGRGWRAQPQCLPRRVPTYCR
jgi:Transglycosylase SLT domain